MLKHGFCSFLCGRQLISLPQAKFPMPSFFFPSLMHQVAGRQIHMPSISLPTYSGGRLNSHTLHFPSPMFRWQAEFPMPSISLPSCMLRCQAKSHVLYFPAFMLHNNSLRSFRIYIWVDRTSSCTSLACESIIFFDPENYISNACA